MNSTIFILSSTIGTCTIVLKRHLMSWRIFILSEGKPTIARTLNWLCWDDYITRLKGSDSSHSKLSIVAKSIYNSISDACWIVFVPNLATQSPEVGHNSVQTWQSHFTSSIFHYGCMALTSPWVKWWESSKWSLAETDLWIYFLFIFQKEGRQLLERGLSWKKYGKWF